MRYGMKIADMRCRPPFKAFMNEGHPFCLFDKESTLRKGNFQSGCPDLSRTIDSRSMDDFIQEMDTAGVDLAVAPYRAAWGDPCNHRAPTDNGELVELMEKYPGRILGVPGISPIYHTPDEIEAQINKYVVNGPCRGVAVEPAIDKPNWLLNDKRAMFIYDICAQHGIPVLITFRSMSLEQLAALEEISGIYRNKVNFVLCHGGGPRTLEVIDLAFWNGNIYISPDGTMPNSPAGMLLAKAANYMLRDRILFGSAFPRCTMQFAVDYWLSCGIREEVRPDIMYGNAARLFGLED